MNDERYERCVKLWERYFVEGQKYGRVTTELAEEYGVKKNTIEKEISKVDEWLPEIADESFTDGISRLKELRTTRQRMHRLATEARQAKGKLNRKDERKILKNIVDMIETDIKLSQSLGETVESANETQHTIEGEIGMGVGPSEAYQQMLDQAMEMRNSDEIDPAQLTDGPEKVDVAPAIPDELGFAEELEELDIDIDEMSDEEIDDLRNGRIARGGEGEQ